jgi:hypothetical protein
MMDEKITITIIIGIIAVVFGITTIVVALQRKPMSQFVYIFGLVTAAALVGLVGAGIVIGLTWLWVGGALLLSVWLLYLGMYESAHHKPRRRRRRG